MPVVREPVQLATALLEWEPSRPLCACDERGSAPPLSEVVAKAAQKGDGQHADLGLLVGPEGGFAQDEFQSLAALPFVELVSLSSNTLRAETAALAALAVIGCR